MRGLRNSPDARDAPAPCALGVVALGVDPPDAIRCVCVCVCVCVCMLMYVCMHVCVCMYVCMYIFLYGWFLYGWMDGWTDRQEMSERGSGSVYVCAY